MLFSCGLLLFCDQPFAYRKRILNGSGTLFYSGLCHHCFALSFPLRCLFFSLLTLTYQFLPSHQLHSGFPPFCHQSPLQSEVQSHLCDTDVALNVQQSKAKQPNSVVRLTIHTKFLLGLCVCVCASAKCWDKKFTQRVMSDS